MLLTHLHRHSLLIVLALVLLTACTSPTSGPVREADTASLPNPPATIRTTYPEGVAAPSPRTGAVVEVNPDQPFYYASLSIEGGPGVVQGEGGIAWLPPQQAFAARFRLENGTTSDREVTILCLVDYRQVACDPTRITLRATVPSGTAVEEPLQFAGLAPGGHIVYAVALAYLPVPASVYEHPGALGELVMRSPEFLFAHSVTLFAGDYTLPAPPLDLLPAGPDNPNTTGNVMVEISPPTVQSALDPSMHPNLVPESNFQGALIPARPGEQVSFSLLSGHDAQAVSYTGAAYLELPALEDGVPVVLAAFLDDTQIPLNPGEAVEPLFGVIPRGQEMVLPITIVAPEEPGVYSLNILYQESPFLPRGTLSGGSDATLDYEFLGALSQIAVSPRVFIQVLP